MNNGVWVILGLVVLISIIDIFGNVMSFIPIIGNLLETASETVLESIQLILVAVGLKLASG